MPSKFVSSILWFGGCSLLGYVLLLGTLNNQETKMKAIVSDRRYQQSDTKNNELLVQVLKSTVSKKRPPEEEHHKTET